MIDTGNIRVGMISLGCPKALVDTQVMAGEVRNRGMTLSFEPEDSDIVVVNTCGFLQASAQESLSTIGKMVALKREGRCRAVIVAGCLVERYPQRILEEYPDVDAILGTSHFEEIAAAIDRVMNGGTYRSLSRSRNLLTHESPIYRLTPAHFAYVKIAEGCDHPCRFCVIPRIKGRHKSRTLEDIECEVKRLAGEGAKELVLVAQDTTDYGRDIYRKQVLPDLIRRVAAVPGIEWIRILYSYPAYVTDELIDVIAHEEKVCKYLDMPLQHADNEMLRRMARLGSVEEYRRLIEKMRSRIKNLVLRTTFIVGYPGEKEEHFVRLLDFMKEIRFERLGVFCFSREPGTSAYGLDEQVSETDMNERRHRAMTLQQGIVKEFNQKLAGRVVRVICDRTAQDREFMEARSYFDAPDIDGVVYVHNADKKLEPGDMADVRIVYPLEYDLVGQFISKP